MSIEPIQATPATSFDIPVLGGQSAPIIERAPLPILEVQGPGHLVSYVNSAFCALLGKTRRELIGKPFAQIVHGGEQCISLLDRVYQTGEALSHLHEEDAPPQPAYWLYAMWPSLDAHERPSGVIIQLTRSIDFRLNATAINEALLIAGLRQHELNENTQKLNAQLQREIAERKLAQEQLADQAGHLELLVAERTKKLQETISELEAFSYSLTHDLRAPLRAMQSFAAILAEECAAQVTPEGQDYIRRIVTSADRMDKLIRDVLNYSSVIRTDLQLTPVNLDLLLRGIIESYPTFQQPPVQIILQGLFPSVLANEAGLTQCISNLLGNALKFVAPGAIPRVRVWAETHEQFVRLSFQDNGIGIPQESHEKIFQIFQRLGRDFEGTGIGLAIVKKAIERMSGRVGLVSKPGKGTTFWLDLLPAPTVPSL